ncbi:MAG: AMP-binding protein [Bdellovibrionota bacterium]|jgi:acyl-coenzyme A synthetase/AMP-(fatty) acid ligase/3-hydroxymyristoyl/3-hydroxydecanoyl-(acyl carrier protein) dehydratase
MSVHASIIFTARDRDLTETLFINNGKAITRGAFEDNVAKYAAYFSKLPEKEVLLFILDDELLFATCFFALLQAHKRLLLPPFIKPAFLAPLLNNSTLLVTNHDVPESLDSKKVIKVPLKLPQTDFTFSEMSAEEISFFSSGSSGTPKQIKKTYRNLAMEVENILETQKDHLSSSPTVIGSVVNYHVYGMLWKLLFPISAALTVDLDLIETPEALQKKQSLYKKLLFVTTPTFLDKLIKYKEQCSFSDNYLAIFTSGSLLKEDTSQATYDLFGVSPFEIFGSTETGGVASRQQKNGQLWHIFPAVSVTVDGEKRLAVSSEFSCKSPFQMQDAVELHDESRTFILKGRTDRVVKIFEKLVSLPDMEEAFQKHPYVQRCYLVLLDNDTHLSAVITLTQEGREFLKVNSKRELNLLLNRAVSHTFDDVTLPKKFRYVYEIPVNSQGKILREAIAPLFANNVMEPLLEDVVWNDTSFTAKLSFVRDAVYFQGHFPEVAILPGVVQVSFVHLVLKQFWGVLATDFDILKLKFAAIIFSTDQVTLEVVKSAENKFSFLYKKGDLVCSSGILTKGS